jgi:peptidoglycan/xylan/chitin deacetylase (PgdA/CDA1 family)
VFIVSGLTGEERIRSENEEFMTWNEIRELHSCGIQIGSHTVNHPELYRLSPPRIEDEVRRSKETIEDKLGSAVSSFSYPFAFPEQDLRFTVMVRGFLEKCGYENGVCTIIGTAGSHHNRYFLPRLPINSYDDLRFFKAKLERGYDWLHQPQRLYKSFLKRAAPGTREPNRDIHCCE